MHLVEILQRRGTTCAGVYLAVTRRCPLACAHCCTDSNPSSEEHEDNLFTDFVGTFTSADRPDIVFITGGEALVRPRLVSELAAKAQSVGGQVVLGTGMFFARAKELPEPIATALESVDHIVVSMDFHHESQVPKLQTFAAMRKLLDRGKHLSVQLTRRSLRDEYADDIVKELRSTFSDRVPVLIGNLNSLGRGADLLELSKADLCDGPEPCAYATWPVVSYDGTIVACCNQLNMNGPVPRHLYIGHVKTDSWATVLEKLKSDILLNAIRVYGPRFIASKYSEKKRCSSDYCDTCRGLGKNRENLSHSLQEAHPGMLLQHLSDYIGHVRGQQYQSFSAEDSGSLLELGRPSS